MTMVHQVVWVKCNVFNDKGESTTYSRGDLLPDGVDSVQLEQLRVIGAVRVMESVPTEEELRAEMAGQSEAPSPDVLAKPLREDNKDAWVSYASDPRNPNRISETEAKAMSKSALVDKYS